MNLLNLALWRLVAILPLLTLSPFNSSADAPANDHFTNSVHLEGTNVVLTGNLLGATREPDEPRHASSLSFQMTGESAWWSWVAPFTGRAALGGVGIFDVQAAVYTGQTVSNLQRVYVNSNIRSFRAEQGAVYHIAFERRVNGNAAVNSTLQLTLFSTNMPNDNFSNSAPSGTWSANFSASREPGEPAHRAVGPNKSLWWSHRAPQNCQFSFRDTFGVIPDATLAVYTGQSVETLTLVAKWAVTNFVNFNATGGEWYHVAYETKADMNGDMQILASFNPPDGRVVPAPNNLVANPSFESEMANWEMQGSYTLSVNTPFNYGADGLNFVALSPWATASQSLTTVTGVTYRVRFALQAGSAVAWFGSEASSQFTGGGTWAWGESIFVASTNVTLLTIQATADVKLDKITVTPMNIAPQMVQQPQNQSAFPGGAATFVAGVTGSEPLFRQWRFNGIPMAGQNTAVLQLSQLTTTNAGVYDLVATNLYGSITSSPANLAIEEDTHPAIILHPASRSVFEGDYVTLNVVAIGTPPLSYQWFRNDQLLAAETSRNLVITSCTTNHVGSYKVVVAGFGETVTSLPAQLSLLPPATGGGQILFANRVQQPGFTNMASVFDTGGVVPLAGASFLAQLYVGVSTNDLQAVGQPQPFLEGFLAGYIANTWITLPQFGPQQSLVAQVRAWETASGASYEEARAWGGKTGVSAPVNVLTAGGLPASGDGLLLGLQSFSVAAGLPEYRRGRIEYLHSNPDGAKVWEMLGQPGAQYLIEWQLDGANWNPLQILSNPTGRARFTNQPPDATVVLLRAQLLP